MIPTRSTPGRLPSLPKTGPFLWGAATSSYQIEGQNQFADWYHWEKLGKTENGATCGKATDHRSRFIEDLDLAQSLGLNTYRFSLEWSRLEQSPGHFSKVDFDWYRDLVHACEARGLLPMVTLHHFTLPQWLSEKGGLLNESFPDHFGNYVRKVTQVFGSHVPIWCTVNEPVCLAVGAYLGKFMPPGDFSPRKCGQSLSQLLRAHVQGYDILHQELKENRKGPWKQQSLQVGFAHNMMDFSPMHPRRILENALTRVFHRFYNQSFLDAVTGKKQHFGAWGLIPFAPQIQEARGRRTVDFIGINYYTKAYVAIGRSQGRSQIPDGIVVPFKILFSTQSEVQSDLGWAYHPSGLKNILQFVGEYGLPIFLTENGIADEKDQLRPKYLLDHLKVMANAISSGLDIRGYYHWSLLDNFEWIKGFGPRFGLFEVDYNTFARKERPSADLYRRVIAAHHDQPRHEPSSRILEGFTEAA